MSNFKEEFESLTKKIEEKKMEQVRLQERQKQLTEEKEKINVQLKELNLESIEQAKSKVETLEKDITEDLIKCNNLLK